MTATFYKTEKVAPDKEALALQGFFSIIGHWKVDNAAARKILGNPAERTFYEWKKGKVARVPENTLRRIGYVAVLLEGAANRLFSTRA